MPTLPSDKPLYFLVSRTDNLGDVVLTLPLCAVIKQLWPKSHITFLGKAYTAPIITACKWVDAFLDKEEALKLPSTDKPYDVVLHVFPNKNIARLCKAWGIGIRIGTGHRLYHWTTCTHRPRFSRKSSPLHEATLNLELLRPIWPSDRKEEFTTFQQTEWLGQHFGLQPLPAAVESVQQWPADMVVLHPKSQGSAREWPLKKYQELANTLIAAGKQVAITGTAAEGERMQTELPNFFSTPGLLNLCGKLSLAELIAFLHKSSAVVACSTGPLHIATALGVPLVGLYPPIRPMHAGRWGPIGPGAHVLVKPMQCQACAKASSCTCMQELEVWQMMRLLERGQ